MRNGPYILVVAPKKYPGKKYRGKYAYEHHLNWWSETKSIVPKGYILHHKNHNKHDNSFENLEMLSIVEHAIEHGKNRYRKKKRLKCSNCGKKFLRELRQIKKHSKNNYCDRSCMGFHQRHSVPR